MTKRDPRYYPGSESWEKVEKLWARANGHGKTLAQQEAEMKMTYEERKKHGLSTTEESYLEAYDAAEK